MKEMITSKLEIILLLCKIVLSAPIPRVHSCSLNSQDQLISALLKDEDVSGEKVVFCNNSNLPFTSNLEIRK